MFGETLKRDTEVTIEPTGRLVFLVSGKYAVDLEDGEQCDCPHYRCRLAPNKSTLAKEQMRCKHIVACRDWLADRVIEQLNQTK